MTIKEVKEMKLKGFENYTKDQLLGAYAIVNSNKKVYAAWEKDIKDSLGSMMSVGDQLSLDFGPKTFTSSMLELEEISFDCSDEDLYSECQAVANMYCSHGVNKTEIKKDYKKGTLHPDLIKHIVVTKQQKLKMSDETRKEEE